jgi:hypothetical protein
MEQPLKIRRHVVTALVLSVIPGMACTSTIVRPVESVPSLSHVCIRENSKVLVHDFVPVVRDALSQHGIRSEVFSGEPPAHCDVILTYTALRRWDLGAYLSHAEVRLERDGLQIGYAEYHLRGGGGFSLFKWQGTRTKMEPVLSELLAQVGR